MKKARVGIIGGAGYTGGELLRLLLNHDAVEIAFIQSRSQVGLPVHKVHSDLLGVTSLTFTDSKADFEDPTLDAVFLALPHGKAKELLAETRFGAGTRIVDLSQDFRLQAEAKMGDRKFIYGLPEVSREEIKKAKYIANPGCFATAIQLALLPLAHAKQVDSVAVTGITGSTGAGQKLAETSHFSFRANNIQAYKVLSHQHIAEIEETLHFVQGDARASVSFVPWRGDFTRGIFVSALIKTTLAEDQAFELYRSYYQGHPFVAVSKDPIDLKSVVNTNRAVIEINSDRTHLAIHCAIDNLLKGASGQAVQNFNLMMGFEETQGLKLKGTGF